MQQLEPIVKFEISNQDVVNELIEKANNFGEVTEENLEAADEFIKGGKKIGKVVEGERLNFTRKIDELKKEWMKPEKSVADALKPIEERVLAIKREIHNREEAKRQEEIRIQREKVEREQAEIRRKEAHQKNLVSFKSNLLAQLHGATLETIDSVERSIRAQVVSEEKWEEFAPQAKAILEEVKGKFAQNRTDLKKASEDQAAADKLAEQRAEQQRQQEEAAKIERDRIASETFSGNMAVTREADTAIQAASGVKVAGVKKVRKWEVIDLSSVPARYLTLNEKLINEEVKAGIPNIPGLRIYEDLASTGR